ncbi:MAG: heparan-alpha-glucosaminide N-acetyltransferase domain-containing protein [Desulfobacterales bacterium]
MTAVANIRLLPQAETQRLAAIDVMRGVVIVLMAFDHASGVINAGRYVTDSIAFYEPGSVIPAAQFWVRWLTHLCAPTFLFLAGWSLSLSVGRQTSAGVPAGRIDGFILKRGLLIMLLDPLWMSIGFGHGIVFQILYAIGGSLCCMIFLRRLDSRVVIAVSLILMVFAEALAGLAVGFDEKNPPGVIAAFLVTGGRVGSVAYVLYPLLPWLGYMALGWGVAGLPAVNRADAPTMFGRLGIFSLALFALVRGVNHYGNMLLYRDDATLLQWLHVSKYPPSLSFAALELGIMFLCLAVLCAWYRDKSTSRWNPLTVFGQTPLFFYLLHVHLLAVGAWLLGLRDNGGLIDTLVATLAALLILYPLCLWYRSIKQRTDFGLLHYL